jgi:hypothetical protein
VAAALANPFGQQQPPFLIQTFLIQKATKKENTK